jgi:transcriptional regulator with XRE-family HTH domain
MTIRYDEIGQRLRAFRLGSGMSADEIAKRIGISRTAVYRFEKGEVVKIETLSSLANLLGVSLPTLLGVEIEYISSAVTYFERLRQLEEGADRITVLAGPISFVLASQEFRSSVGNLLRESIADDDTRREKLLQDIDRIIEILEERRRNYEARRPAMVNLMSALDIDRLLRSGFVGRPFMSDSDFRDRQRRARVEVEHFAKMMEAEPMGIQIGLVVGTLPHAGFQIFRTGDRKTLTISPFRLGEQPNVRLGVAMITENHEAVALHEAVVEEMWRTALKGVEAAVYLRALIAAADGKPVSRDSLPKRIAREAAE